MIFVVHWFLAALAIVVAAYILPGVTISGFGVALLTALVLGLVNVFIRPLALFFTLPLNILTLGLFTFVINALMILIVSALTPGFRVDGFWLALLFSIVVSFVSYLLGVVFTATTAAVTQS